MVEQNIMKNIGYTFFEFSKLYYSLYPYDSIDIIEKFLKIIMLLKQKKYQKVDGSWKDIYPIKPLSIINKDLLPSPHLYRVWLWGDSYAWRWNYSRRII